MDDELDFPKRKTPEAGPKMSQQVLRFVHRLREKKLFNAPAVAETIDWAHALVELDCLAVDPATADTTLGVLLKYQDDISKIRGTEAARILAQVQTEILG